RSDMLIYSADMYYTFFLFNATPPPQTYTLSLHDALPISEIQDAGEDAHDLAFRAAKRARERVAVESERIDSRTRKDVGLSDLDRPVLELLREHPRNGYAASHSRNVPLSEHLEDQIDCAPAVLQVEHRDAIESALLDTRDARVGQEAPKGLREGRRGFRLVFDFMQTEPTSGFVEQLCLPACGRIDPKDDFVSSLVRLVDVTANEILPLRDEGPYVEGGEGSLHSFRSEEPG